VKLVAIGGTVAGFGVVWSLVAANVVGVTSRQATPAGGTSTGGTADANGVAAPRQDPSFFQGAGVQAPSFVGGTGSTAGSASGSTSSTSGSTVASGTSGSTGSSSHKLPTVGGFGGFGNFGGPLVVSGSS
jgi:hypothetical protein